MPHSDRNTTPTDTMGQPLTSGALGAAMHTAVVSLPDLTPAERGMLLDYARAFALQGAGEHERLVDYRSHLSLLLKVLQRAVKDAAAWHEVGAANTIIKALRATLRMVETGWEGVWFWQEDGRNDLPSLTCPVVLEADTMRKLMDQLHERSREVQLHRRTAAARHPACVCGKTVNDEHRLVAAYGAWCCPDRLADSQKVTQVEAPPVEDRPAATDRDAFLERQRARDAFQRQQLQHAEDAAPSALDRDALLELANGRIEHQRQQMLELSRQLADKVREVQQLRDALQLFEDERFAVREVVGHLGDLKPAVLAYAERRVEEERDDFLRRVTMLSTAKVRL